jgi:hypothetical protein
MTDDAIVLRGVEQDVPEDVREMLEFTVSDDAWEMAFIEADVEYVEDIDVDTTLAAKVGNMASDDSANLTAHERSKLEEAARLIAAEEDREDWNDE